MLHADMLSRCEDASEVFLSHAAFKRVCWLPRGVARWGFPTLDVFAGAAAQQHQVSRYYTLHHTSSAVAVDAMYQPWRMHAQVAGKSALLWVFPPFLF